METVGIKYVFEQVSPFKSYYVVWKHKSKIIKAVMKKRFKSYYVVWKLSSQKLKPKILMLFKSYYVVWKPNFGLMR